MAIIEITLCKSPEEGIAVTIRREFSSLCGFPLAGGRAMDRWFIDGERTTKEAVANLVGTAFHIRLENLCQFLLQDRLVEFSRLSASELLVATMEAIEPSTTLVMQRQLVDMGDELRRALVEISAIEKDITSQSALNEHLLPQVERYRANMAHQTHIMLLKAKRPWLEYNEARSTFLHAKTQRDNAQEAVDQATTAVLPLKKELANLLGELEVLKSSRSACRLDTLEERRTALQGRLAANQVEGAKEHLATINSQDAALRQRFGELIAELETLAAREAQSSTNRSQHERNLELLGPELTEAGERRRRIQSSLQDVANLRADIEAEGTELQRKINGALSRYCSLPHGQSYLLFSFNWHFFLIYR